jgi:hypothetical protein
MKVKPRNFVRRLRSYYGRAGAAAVEAEDELVEIGVQVFAAQAVVDA